MTNRTIILNSYNFSTLEDFYNEVDKALTRGLTWKTGHNLDAFNDLLRGGFGIHEYEEPIKLIWQNSQKSKNDFNKVMDGKTLYEILVEIIKSHNHIDFSEE